jgi:hypothetical protein
MPVKIRQCLQVRLVLNQLLSATMQQPNVRICTLHDFSVQLQEQPQHSMGCWMLRSKIDGVVFNFEFIGGIEIRPCPLEIRDLQLAERHLWIRFSCLVESVDTFN